MNIERRLRLINKVSSLRTHVDCMEALAELDIEKHNSRKILIEKAIVKIRDGACLCKGVWVRDTLICILPNDCDRRRELTDAIFDTVCVFTEGIKHESSTQEDR